MKINFSTFSLAAYVIPALTSYWVLALLGKVLNEFAIHTICSTAVAAWMVYWISCRLFANGFAIKLPNNQGLYTNISTIFMIVGLLAVFFNFISVRSIPLFGGDSERVLMQESILWNVYILCSVGVFLSAYIKNNNRSFNRFILFLYLLSALLTGWKGTLLTFIILYIVPQHKNHAVSLWVLSKVVFLLIILLFGVNALRSSEDGFSIDFIAPVFYVYWGFVNFSDIASGFFSDCIYSNPLSTCKFSFENDMLASSTWNVYTALMPLYIDGGLFYTIVFFASVAFFLSFASKVHGSFFIDYLFFMCSNFFLIAHNGYLFSSKSIWVSLGILGIVDMVRLLQSKHDLAIVRNKRN